MAGGTSIGGTGVSSIRGICLVWLTLSLLQGTACQESGRFRYGAISWSRADTNTLRVTVTVESAWRLSHGSIVKFGTTQKVSQPGDTFKVVASENEDPLVRFGDGQMTARYDVTVLRVDPLQDMVVGRTEFVHNYPGVGHYIANLTLCCRVAGTQNALRSTFLQTIVDLTLTSLGSAVFSVIPIVSLDATRSGVRTFRIPAVRRDDVLSFSVATSDDEYGYRSDAPPSNGIYPIVMGIDPTGVMHVNATCYASTDCVHGDINVVVFAEAQGAHGYTKATVDFIIRFQGPTANAIPTLTLVAPSAPSPLESFSSSIVMGMPVVEAFVGFNVRLTVQGADTDASQSVFFEFSTLPQGAVAGASEGTNPSSRVISWTPSASQVGMAFVCASSMDLDHKTQCEPCDQNANPECTPACPSHRRSQPLCFELAVKEDPLPAFQDSATTLTAYMNSQVRCFFTRVRIWDVCLHDILICSVTSVIRRPKELRVVGTDANWADSVTVSAFNLEEFPSASLEPVTGLTNAVDFVWSPGRNFGGSAKQIRFLAEDSKGNRTPLDVTLMVEKCVWNVAPGDTLDSIATIFGTNYVQMWALNVEKDTPDEVLQKDDKVQIGHRYRVRATDNLRYLSVQFATTRETIELLNYEDIAANTGEKDPLASLAGTELCILPHSCVSSLQAA